MSAISSAVVLRTRLCTFLTSMPVVPSNTCTTARFPRASRTWPLRSEPSGRVKLTISLYRGNLTLSKITRGPLTPPIVLYFNRGLMLTMRWSRPASADGAMVAELLQMGREHNQDKRSGPTCRGSSRWSNQCTAWCRDSSSLKRSQAMIIWIELAPTCVSAKTRVKSHCAPGASPNPGSVTRVRTPSAG